MVDRSLNSKPDAVADFAPGAATWRTGQNIHVVPDSGLFLAVIFGTQTYKPGQLLYLAY